MERLEEVEKNTARRMEGKGGTNGVAGDNGNVRIIATVPEVEYELKPQSPAQPPLAPSQPEFGPNDIRRWTNKNTGPATERKKSIPKERDRQHEERDLQEHKRIELRPVSIDKDEQHGRKMEMDMPQLEGNLFARSNNFSSGQNTGLPRNACAFTSALMMLSQG